MQSNEPLSNPLSGETVTRRAPLIIRIVEAVVAVVAVAMIAIPVTETLARRFFHTDLPLAIVSVQHLTLWIGFLGALLATFAHSHLALSTVSAIPEKFRREAEFLRQAVPAAVATLLAIGALRVVSAEWESGTLLFWGVRVAASESIMPVTFAAMALRYTWGPLRTPVPWSWRLGCVVAIGLAIALGFLAPSPILMVASLVVLAAAFFAGAPIFIAMGGLAMLLFWYDGSPIAAVPSETFRLVTQSTLPAIPLLTIAGYLLAEGGAAKRLVNAYKGFFGWLPGGVAVMVTVVCAIFTTFTGGSGVTILALGGLLYPMLRAEKYPEGFSLGLVTASGSLGLLFPPSLPVLLYSVVAEVPAERLYIGGLLPGILMMAMVAGYGVWTGHRLNLPRSSFAPLTALRGLWDAKWDLGLPFVITGSVISGFATVVEASALGCAYALFVEVVVFRTVRPLRDLPRIFSTAARLVGSVVILLGMAMGLSSYLVDAEIPSMLIAFVTSHIASPWIFLLLLNLGLLVLGSVLEIYAAIVVLAPLVAPIGASYGIDPVHLGVVFLANLELGFLFPPMGINLFLSSSRFQKPLTRLYVYTAPFLVILAIGVLLVTYLDFMTTGFVRLFAR